MKVVSTPGLFWEHLAFRVGPGGHPALRNKLVRRALAYGIDRAALVRILENRFGRSAPRLAPLQSVVYPARNPDYEPSWDRYRYRPALARRLLARAGCRPGTGGIRVCGGERLVITVGTTAGNDRRVAALETIQTQLRSIGVDVRPQFLPVVAAVTRALAAGHLDGALFASFFDLNDLQARFGCGGGDNHTGHCSRLVTRELDNAARVVDDESQARALKRAEHLLAQDVPILPLFRAPSLVAYRTAIRNFVPEDVLWNVEDWWLER